MIYTVKYHAGTYFGHKTVNASDEDEAVAKVRAWVRRQMISPMYSESYRVVESIEDEEDEGLEGGWLDTWPKPDHFKRHSVIRQSHSGNLVVETPTTRIWVSRKTRADGAEEDNQVTVLKLRARRWGVLMKSRGSEWEVQP